MRVLFLFVLIFSFRVLAAPTSASGGYVCTTNDTFVGKHGGVMGCFSTAGSGNFLGALSSTAHDLVGFADTTGTVGEDSGVLASSGDLTANNYHLTASVSGAKYYVLGNTQEIDFRDAANTADKAAIFYNDPGGLWLQDLGNNDIDLLTGNTGTIHFTTNTVTDVMTISNLNVNLPLLTASKPVFTDASKNLTSSGTVPVANGGTNSTTALNNNRVMKSSGGAIVEAAAITASKGLCSDTNGIPIACASGPSATEMTYLAGVTSAIQTQINAKAPSASPNFTTQVTFGNYHLEPCENNAGSSGATLTLDLSTCSAQKVTVTANVTFTLSNPVTGGAYVLKLVQDATGSRTYTWPGTVKWSGGTAPTGSGANKVDLINLYWDGTNYFGTSSLNY